MVLGQTIASNIQTTVHDPGFNRSFTSTVSFVSNSSIDHPFLGLGAADPSDPTNIVPVATFPAQPGVQYFIYPVTKYYIAWGTYVPGEIIDVKSLGDVQEIDFTGKPYKAAKIVHNDDGTYTVTYQ